MDVTPETPSSPFRKPNDVYESCSHALSSMWLQKQLLTDFDKASRQVLDCPLMCGRHFTPLMALVNHIPHCERLSTGRYWSWNRQIEAKIPVQCRCRPGNAQDAVKIEEDWDNRPRFPSESFQDQADTARNTFLRPPTPLAWTSQECLSSVGPRRDQIQEGGHQIINNRNPLEMNQMATMSDVPVLTRTPATGDENMHLGTTDVGFDTRNYEPGSFDKPWTHIPMANDSRSRSPMGFGDEGSNLFPSAWAVGVNTPSPAQQQQLQSPQIPTQLRIATSQNPPSQHSAAGLVPGYSEPGQEPSSAGPPSRMQISGHIYGNSSISSPRARRQLVASNPITPVVPQDGILPSLKACFYSLLLPRDRALDHPLIVQLQQYLPHNVLVGSLSELGRVVSHQPVKGPFNKLCFAYLSLAMGRTIEDYLGVKLPSERTVRMESEIKKLLLSPESTALSPAFMNSTHSFLDLFQVYLKQELRTTCDLSCSCFLSPSTSRAILNKIRTQFPLVNLPDTEQAPSPMQCHRTIRALELDLLRLSPGRLPTTSTAAMATSTPSGPSSSAAAAPPAATTTPELSVEDFFDRYIPAVRKECGLYYCNHLPRAKYHIWVIRLLRRALGAQEDAPLKSAAGLAAAAASGGGLGPPRRASAVSMPMAMSTGELLDEATGMYLAPRSPAPPTYVKVDRATSPAPIRMSLMMSQPSSAAVPPAAAPSSSSVNREQGFACPERACHYVALGSNAKKLLKRHKDALHNPDKQRLPCPNCEKNFTRKDNLKAHIMKKHTQQQQQQQQENDAIGEEMDEEE